MVAAGIFGIPVAKSLSAGGFQDPTSESARATQLLTDKFGQGDLQLPPRNPQLDLEPSADNIDTTDRRADSIRRVPCRPETARQHADVRCMEQTP